jgi:hypothetical protein
MALYNDEKAIKWNQDEKECLRAELKLWERAFEKETGQKPTPADIKANSDINSKYKLYHRSYRRKPSSKSEELTIRTEDVSTIKALKQITPQKRQRDIDFLTPTSVKRAHPGYATETIGPTPQQTPLAKRMKSNWGEQLAEARQGSPRKSTPQKGSLNGIFEKEYV